MRHTVKMIHYNPHSLNNVLLACHYKPRTRISVRFVVKNIALLWTTNLQNLEAVSVLFLLMFIIP